MIKSSNKNNINTIIRYLGKENVDNIESYIDEVLNRDYKSFNSMDELKKFFSNYLPSIYNNSSYENIETIRYYTGRAYNKINSFLRGYWDYEKCGKLTDEVKNEIMSLIKELNSVFKGCPKLDSDIIAYRGVSLSSFHEYGIKSIADLVEMKNQLIYELGYTSTSLLKEKNFFETNEDCNIEIQYYIPKECEEVLPLLSDDLSYYSSSEAELLINKSALSKVVDVEVFDNGTKAIIKVIYIPEKIWNLEVSDVKTK